MNNLNKKNQLLQPTTASATDDFERDYSCRMTTATENYCGNCHSTHAPSFSCALRPPLARSKSHVTYRFALALTVAVAARAASSLAITSSPSGSAFAAATQSSSSALFFTPSMTLSTAIAQAYWCAR